MSDEKVSNKQKDLPLDSLDAAGDAGPASVSGSESRSSAALGSNSAAGPEVGQSPSAPDRPWNLEQIDSALEVSKCDHLLVYKIEKHTLPYRYIYHFCFFLIADSFGH